jgi:hypothetical protein
MNSLRLSGTSNVFNNFNTGSDYTLSKKTGTTDLIMIRINIYYNFLYAGSCMLDACSITGTPALAQNMTQ